MPDYEQSTTVSAPAQALFDYLADVRHLPQYFEAMESAEPTEAGAVKVTALVHGVSRRGEAWFRVDREKQHLSWGSEGENNYRGRLDVTPSGEDGSSVTVMLHTDRVATDEIDDGLRSTLDRIKELVEAGPGPGPTR